MWNRIVFLLALSAVAGFGQYTWHTTTTTFPPTDPSWLSLAGTWSGVPDGSLAMPTSITGGGVRTTLVVDQQLDRAAWERAWMYTHLLGWYSVYDYNLDRDNWYGYSTRIYKGASGPTNLYILRNENGGETVLASYTIPDLTDGIQFSSSYRRQDGANGEGAGIHVRVGTTVIYYRITTLPNMQIRNGIVSAPPGASGRQLTDARVGYLDATAPNTVSGLSTTISNGILTANWSTAFDDANGIGAVRYEVLRGTQSLGFTGTTTWTMPVQPGESFTFNVKSYDGHRSFATPSGIAVAVPPTSSGLVDDSRRVGIHAQSAQWGAMGESIDMRSMNLNYTVPLLKAKGRAGVGLGLGLNYNSQNWRKEGSTVSKVGADVG